MDYKGRLCVLEQQLQKQRERSLSLLEEKEQEIQALKSTFRMLLPGNMKYESPVQLCDVTVCVSMYTSFKCCYLGTWNTNLWCNYVTWWYVYLCTLVSLPQFLMLHSYNREYSVVNLKHSEAKKLKLSVYILATGLWVSTDMSSNQSFPLPDCHCFPILSSV